MVLREAEPSPLTIRVVGWLTRVNNDTAEGVAPTEWQVVTV